MLLRFRNFRDFTLAKIIKSRGYDKEKRRKTEISKSLTTPHPPSPTPTGYTLAFSKLMFQRTSQNLFPMINKHLPKFNKLSKIINRKKNY